MRSCVRSCVAEDTRRITYLVTAMALMGILGVALSLSGCGQSNARTEGENAPPSEVPRNVRVLTIKLAELNEYLVVSGPAMSLRGTNLSSEEAGQVQAIPNDKGSLVRKGAVLVQLDRQLLKAEMDAAIAARELSAYNESRTRQLYDENSVSRIEMLQAETELERADASARAAQIRHDRAAIKAPFDGIVTNRFVEIGQLVAPGMPVARIIDPYTLKLEGTVTEREIQWVREDRTAWVTFDGVDDVAEGHVHWVGFEANPMTGKFDVEVSIDNKDLKYRPGVVGEAQILKEVHEDVIAIPRDAVVQRGGVATVYVVEGDIARQRSVILGPDQGLMVVVEAGLGAGEKLVVRGQRDIHDGSAVLIQEESTSLDGSMPSDPAVVTHSQIVIGFEDEQKDLGGQSR